jgi:hypothetical protein
MIDIKFKHIDSTLVVQDIVFTFLIINFKNLGFEIKR